MSNIGSTALTTAKQEQTQGPSARPRGARQRQFDRGTASILEDARAMAENAAGQGMQLNPMIYRMLGLEPQMQDRSAELAAAQQEYLGLQDQFNATQARFDQLKGIPKNKRSKAQKKEFRQLKKQVNLGQRPLEDAKARFNQLQTMPNVITGFDRMDPNAIDPSSPFSAQNALNQAQATQAERLNQYMAGGEVDPTLKHQYTAAEQALRAKLTERFGADYENTSVGQMALQNFSREKNEAFATYNQQMVEKYNDLAFQGQANLQTLLANQIGLMREPSRAQMGTAGDLSALSGQRISQASGNLAERSAQQGLVTNTIQGGNVAGALGGALSSPAMQNLVGKAATGAYDAAKSGASSLYNWATGANAAAAAIPTETAVAGATGWLW